MINRALISKSEAAAPLKQSEVNEVEKEDYQWPRELMAIMN